MVTLFCHHASQGKVPGKQEDAWIMNRLIKQLTDMGFPVSTSDTKLLLHSCEPIHYVLTLFSRTMQSPGVDVANYC